MKRVFCVLMLLMAIPLLGQNADKASRMLSVQEMTYESFETTNDAIRNTFVPIYTVVTATIDSGTALTDSIDLGDSRVIAFVPDTAWVTATLSFLTWNSITNEWVTLVEDDGTELGYSFTDSTLTIAQPTHFAGIRYLKIRSGTDATPVNQAYSDKAIGILTRRY